MSCLTQSKAESCFTCRAPLSKDSVQVNGNLQRILQSLNWAYDIESTTKAIKMTLPSSNCDNYEGDVIKKEVLNEFSGGPMSVETEDYIQCGIKQESEYPTLTENIQVGPRTKERSKKVRIFIEYLGLSTEQNKKRKLGN